MRQENSGNRFLNVPGQKQDAARCTLLLFHDKKIVKKLVFSKAMCYNRIMTVIIYFFGKNQRIDGGIRRKLIK